MIERAALSRSAVSSTTTGGLPGPATMARFGLRRAARPTAGPPVTHSMRTSRWSKIAWADSSVGLLDDRDAGCRCRWPRGSPG